MDPALVKKLLFKPGHKILIRNAPEGYVERLMPLPDGAELAAADAAGCDVVQQFVRNKADIDALAPAALAALKPGGLLWLSYPKRSPKVQTDINRDTGWETLHRAGWTAVTQIAVNETWSALRFRPQANVGR